MRVLHIFSFAIAVLPVAFVVGGCLPRYNPPSYIKDVVAYQEGDGIVVYFIMADEYGGMTRAKGDMTLCIYQEDMLTGGQRLVYKDQVKVVPSFFCQDTVGMGSFAHEVLMLYYGRISFDEMNLNRVRGRGISIDCLLVEVTFKTDEGKVLRGHDRAFVDY